jgi:predicted component of type VI protein secretion system
MVVERELQALWEAYSQLHEVLEEEKQAFSRIFGPEFAQAYHEHRQRRSTATNDP